MELKLPWRRYLGSKRTGEEEVTELFEPQGVQVDPELQSEDRPMVATWQDGMKKTFVECTYGWWQKLKQNKEKRGRDAEHALWAKRYPVTQNVIKIARRKDIGVLVSLYEQGAQLLQVRADGFEDGVTGGINFLIPIAEMYLKDEVEKGDLKKVRGEMLAKTTYKQRLLDISRERKTEGRPPA